MEQNIVPELYPFSEVLITEIMEIVFVRSMVLVSEVCPLQTHSDVREMMFIEAADKVDGSFLSL